ncbi:MAG: hypothetical protein R3D01_03935 [Hyphomicrobiales bacterium]
MAGYLETAAIDSATSEPVAQVAAIDRTPTEIRARQRRRSRKRRA